MGRERANVQPALSKPQQRESLLVIGKRNASALIAVLHCVRQLHMVGDEADGAKASREDGPVLDR